LGLFREFAALALSPTLRDSYDEDSILQFANAHGDLLCSANLIDEQTERDCATLSVWRREIKQMRMAVGWWDQRNTRNKVACMEKLHSAIMAALADTTTPRFTRAYLDENLKLYVRPMNLLAYMWLCFARVVAGEIKERPCGGCGKYIYSGHGLGLRADTATCNSKCRKRKSRQRAPPA